MRVLLIIRSDTQIRKDILKSRKMDWLNEQCSDSIGKLREIKKKEWEWGRVRERGGQTMNRWHLRKADLCRPGRNSAASQWSRVKRGMKAREWASAGVRVPCIPWAANLPVSPLSPRPASLVWKAAALAAECLLQHIGRQSGCETCQMKVHSTQTHTELSLPLSLWHSAPYMNSAGLNFGGKKEQKTHRCIPIWRAQYTVVMKLFDISRNLYLPPCHSTLTSAFRWCVRINLPEVGLVLKTKNHLLKLCHLLLLHWIHLNHDWQQSMSRRQY